MVKSFIIRLSEFSNSVEWAKKAYDSAKVNGWNVHYFEGVDGRKETLRDYNVKINSKYKKSIRAFERIKNSSTFWNMRNTFANDLMRWIFFNGST